MDEQGKTSVLHSDKRGEETTFPVEKKMSLTHIDMHL